MVYEDKEQEFCIRSEPNVNPLCVVSLRWKHYDPKFKFLRHKKVQPVQLPDFNSKLTKEKFRTRLKEFGLSPPRYWKDEKPITITCLADIIEPYVPPLADGKASVLNKGRTNWIDKLKGKKKNYSSLKKIKSYDSDFNIKTFPQEAHDIYVKAHTVLMNNDPEELSNYVTEKANLEMIQGLKFKTLKWKFIESLEPPVAVQVRTGSVLTETNWFAQVTVRFHTKQCLAIYDRFGRLFYGSEIIPKDVLEYVVFEKHIINEYGTWRLHGKIIPDWAPASEPPRRTYRIENDIEEDDEDDDILEEDDDSMKDSIKIVTKEAKPETVV